MTEKFFPLDTAHLLTSDAAIDVFMADAMETEDASYIAAARAVVERARALRSKQARQDNGVVNMMPVGQVRKLA